MRFTNSTITKFVTVLVLRQENEEAKKLWFKILTKAKEDAEYKRELNLWLQGEKETMHLRYTLSSPFKESFTNEADFVYAWTNLDSISCHIARS